MPRTEVPIVWGFRLKVTLALDQKLQVARNGQFPHWQSIAAWGVLARVWTLAPTFLEHS